MTKKSSIGRLIAVIGLLFACPPSVVDSASIDEGNLICEPGFYTFKENGSNCQICPPGTFSGVSGAKFCKLCLDTFYSDEGANSAELWNGDLYCLYSGLMDDDLLNRNSDDTTTPTTVSVSPSSIQIAFELPSAIPSHAPGPSEAPSFTASTPSEPQKPSTSPILPIVGDFLADDSKSVAVCNDQNSRTNHFEWHGRLKQCPSKYEMFLQPVFVLLILALLTIILEILIPVCFNAHIWWAMEYLHMLYLLGISITSWSPAEAFLFNKFIPIFAIDFNASFSLQCITDNNCSQEDAADQLLALSLPIIFALALTILSKAFGNRIIQDESVSRWIANLLYFDYFTLILGSLEVLRLPTSWSADELSKWVNSNAFYNTLGGFAGLMIYGLAFPFWLLQTISRYHFFSNALFKTDVKIVSCGNCERRYNDPRTKEFTKRRKELFMTIGIFPIHLRRNEIWRPGIWMLRKFLFAVFLFVFPDEEFLRLVIFSLIYFSSITVKQYYLPLNNAMCEASTCVATKKWFSIATMDALLQLCMVTFIGVAFLSLWSDNGDSSTRLFYQDRVEDVVVLLVFSISFVYIIVTIGVCCLQPESRFSSMLSANIVMLNSTNGKVNNNHNNNAATDDNMYIAAKENLAIVARSNEASSMQRNPIECSSPSIPRKELEFSAADIDIVRNHHDISPDQADGEYGAKLKSQTVGCGTPISVQYLVGDDYKQEVNCRKHRTSFERQSEVFRSNSSMAIYESNCDIIVKNYAETVYEEIWIDEDTGKEIPDPQQANLMDAGTGLIAIPPNYRNDHK